MAITKEEILDYIGGMSVLELSELGKAFEEKFGVSAAPTVVAGGAVAAGGAAGGEEKTEFNIVLADAGANKINDITVHEFVVLGAILAGLIIFGLYPNAILGMI